MTSSSIIVLDESGKGDKISFAKGTSADVDLEESSVGTLAEVDVQEISKETLEGDEGGEDVLPAMLPFLGVDVDATFEVSIVGSD